MDSTATSTPIHDDGLADAGVKANVVIDMFLDVDPTKAGSTTDAAYEVMVWVGTVGGSAPIGSGQTSSAGYGDQYTLNGIT